MPMMSGKFSDLANNENVVRHELVSDQYENTEIAREDAINSKNSAIVKRVNEFYTNYSVKELRLLIHRLKNIEIPKATANTIEYMNWYNETYVEPIVSTIELLETLAQMGEDR